MEVTVKSCTEKKRVQGKNGEAIVYSVEMTDGVIAESFAKAIPPGTPIGELEFEDGQWGKKVKLKAKANGFGGGGFKKADKGNESFALSYAKDYACAMIAAGKEFKLEHIIPLADKFFDWMETKKK